jgi:hypothetical protein
MPFFNAIQVIQIVRETIDALNQDSDREKVIIIEPRFVIVSAFVTPPLKKYFEDIKVDKILEKPLALEHLN